MALLSLTLSSGVAGTPCQLSVRQSGSTKRNVALKQEKRAGLLRIRAQEEGKEGSPVEETADVEDFEARLARLQRKVTSGTGKKAEARKARKEGGLAPITSSSTSTSSKKTNDLYIPPVPLKDPVADGLVVEFGLKPYVERINGRIAALGLAALLLVELATGLPVIKFHDSGTIFVQDKLPRSCAVREMVRVALEEKFE
ncbi:hypothetical protein R1sor_019029 [Riccia sorocarpa]|uniref:Chlororespiratory reduction 41 n=1 Tax=Riccia sorocarpa TaxID=122646 RepID=A0ABD3IFL2_9MARC